MYRTRAACRYRDVTLILAVLGLALGCGESVLVARELDQLEPDAGVLSSAAGSRKKQAINAERARIRARSSAGDHGADSKKR